MNHPPPRPARAQPPTPAAHAPTSAPAPLTAAPLTAAILALLLIACADPPADPIDQPPGHDAATDTAADTAADTALDDIDHDLDAIAGADGTPAPDIMPDAIDATPDPIDPPLDATLPDATPPDATPPDATPDHGLPCPDPPGARCKPIAIDTFPAELHGDTTTAPEARIDAYTCAPTIDERGGEVWHVIDLPTPALLTARLDDQPGDDVDIDLHLLAEPDPLDPLDRLDRLSPCLARANATLTRYLPPGRWSIVLDTWTAPDGRPRAGAYTLTLDLTPLDGPCAYDPRPLRMVWPTCDPTLDCYQDADATWLRTPAHGPVVKEAHLVTDAEAFPEGWPIAARDAIDRHYAISEATTAYAMPRREPWAPAGEGGSEWGQSAHARPLPVLDEAWYVNQYWRQRPPPGTRMIVYNPANGRAVVAAGGYETGPGAHTAIAGASEEIHHHLGTTHRDPLLVGFAADPALPLGPIDCGW